MCRHLVRYLDLGRRRGRQCHDRNRGKLHLEHRELGVVGPEIMAPLCARMLQVTFFAASEKTTWEPLSLASAPYLAAAMGFIDDNK